MTGREGRVVRGKPWFLVGRPAGTGLEDPQRDTIPSQLWHAMKCCRVRSGELRKDAEIKEVWGVNPKPLSTIGGVVGVGLHADTSARLSGRAPLPKAKGAPTARKLSVSTYRNPQTPNPKPYDLRLGVARFGKS